MTLHAPAQHAGASTHHWMRDILIVGIVAVLTVGGVWALSSYRPFATTVSTTEAQQLIEFRAAERADTAAGVTSETQSIVDFRAGERGATVTTPVQRAADHHGGERVPNEPMPR